MKSAYIKCFAMLFIFTVSSVIPAAAETFRVMLHTGSFPPYFFEEKDPRTGTIKDVFSALAKETGDSFEYVRVPFKRALRQFEMGKIDLEPMTNPAFRPSTSVPGIYSIPYTEAADVILFQAEHFVAIESPRDLLRKTIGVIKGYHYPDYDAYFTEGLIKTHPLDSEEKMIELLLARRLEQVLISSDFAQYQIREQGLEGQLKIGQPHHQLEMMIRFHPSKEHAVERFNLAIEKLLSNGSIDQIYSRYQ